MPLTQTFHFGRIGPDDTAARALGVVTPFDPSSLEPPIERDNWHTNLSCELGQPPLVRL
jgi:hypothetical protein